MSGRTDYERGLDELTEKHRAITDHLAKAKPQPKAAEPPAQPPPTFAEVEPQLRRALDMLAIHMVGDSRVQRAREWVALQGIQ